MEDSIKSDIWTFVHNGRVHTTADCRPKHDIAVLCSHCWHQLDLIHVSSSAGCLFKCKNRTVAAQKYYKGLSTLVQSPELLTMGTSPAPVRPHHILQQNTHEEINIRKSTFHCTCMTDIITLTQCLLWHNHILYRTWANKQWLNYKKAGAYSAETFDAMYYMEVHKRSGGKSPQYPSNSSTAKTQVAKHTYSTIADIKKSSRR